MRLLNSNTFYGVVSFALGLTFVSCGGDSDTVADLPSTKIEANAKKDGSSQMLNIEGRLFSISSPLESIVALKNSNAKFNESVMLEAPDMSQLTSNFDKALYLGMIGADMGYASIHEQQMKSVSQLKILNDLAEGLNLGNAVDKSLVKRLANNTDNKDSLMILVSEFYRQADQYLHKNDRMDVASWILAGGWIESMHFSLDVINQGNEALKDRVAGQKNSYKNLLDLVRNHNIEGKSSILVKELERMEVLFDEVDYQYNFSPPEVDIDSKTTVLKGTTSNKLSDETLAKLTEAVSSLRSKMIAN